MTPMTFFFQHLLCKTISYIITDDIFREKITCITIIFFNVINKIISPVLILIFDRKFLFFLISKTTNSDRGTVLIKCGLG